MDDVKGDDEIKPGRGHKLGRVLALKVYIAQTLGCDVLLRLLNRGGVDIEAKEPGLWESYSGERGRGEEE